MTAQRRPAVRKSDTKPDRSGWPDVVWHAIDDWRRTLRLCLIVVVVGAVLLLAARLGLRLWL